MPVAVVFAVALLAWLCVAGATLLSQVLKGILGSIPLIGGALGRFVSFDFGLLRSLWSHLRPFPPAVSTPHVQHATEQGLTVVAAQAAWEAINGTQVVSIPRAQAAAVSRAVAIGAPHQAEVDRELGNLNTAVAGTGRQISALQSAVRALPAPQTIATHGEVQGAVAQSTATSARALDARTGQIEGDIRTAAAGAQAGAVRQLAPQIGAIQTDLGGLAHTVTGVLAPGLAGVATLAEGLVGRIAQVERCTGGICATGSGDALGGLGKLLQELAPLLEGGILFALAAEAARDPEGVARAVVDAVGGTVEGAAAATRDAVGLAA